MNSEFEERLGSQAFRPIPREWRDQILRAAQPGTDAAGVSRWWREWLWPCPRAWAALAAAWPLIMLLHFAAPSGSPPAANIVPMSWQSFQAMQREVETFARLPDWSPPEPAAPQPRASRRVKQNIG